MKKLLLSLAIASTALSAAAPAAAQNYGRERQQERYDDRYEDRRDGRGYDQRGYGNADVRPQLHRLSQQITRGVERGNITNGEARRLRGEVQSLWQLASRFHASGGYDRRESFELNRRIARVQEQVRFERRDGDRRNWR